jgi:long-subunit acyl-CoA synthetase (AMP-forming)
MGSSNNINYYLPVFSAWLCGGVVSIADPNISDDQIKHQLQDTSASIVAVQNQFQNKYIDIRARASHHFKIVIIDGKSQEYLGEDVYNMDDLIQSEEYVQDNFELEDLNDPSEDALILWSSGSTGKPKGIVHSQINLLTADIPTSAKHHFVTNNVLMSNIMFHIGGFMIPIRLGFMLELSCGFISNFNAEECLDIIERFAPSVVYLGIGHYIEVCNNIIVSMISS